MHHYLVVIATLCASAIISGCQKPTTQTAFQPISKIVDETTSDVIVVGAGISGLCAALELGRGGAEVTVIDMSSVFGGHAVMSQGGISIAGSDLQRRLGWNDSPDLAYRDFVTWGEDTNKPWVRYYVDHSEKDIYRWLVELGVTFESVETAPGNSVDRFHQPAGRGVGLVTPIYQACLKLSNIRFAWNRQVTRLLVEDQRVVGVKARHLRDGIAQRFSAPHVVLATGGFQSNLDMVREYWPTQFSFPERILAGSGRHSVGHGHRLAENAGGALKNMDYQWNYFTGIPDPRNPGSNQGLSAANMWGIIVNPNAKRFANLHNWAKEVMPRMLAQERATLWFVFDEGVKEKFVVSGSEWSDFAKVDAVILQNRELVQSADTLEQLAVLTGLPAENLIATVARYNEQVKQGRDLDFGRFGPEASDYNNRASPPLLSPPYYAMQAYPLTRKSMGGVAIDLDCRVLDMKQIPIQGLYAVGELTGLAGINGKAALEGTFLGPCVLTGRVAGQTILNQLPSPRPLTAASSTATSSQAQLNSRSSRCLGCHDIGAQLGHPQPGYWHFEQAHRIAFARGMDCLECHADMAPYRADRHRLNPSTITNSCVTCHVAAEVRSSK